MEFTRASLVFATWIGSASLCVASAAVLAQSPSKASAPITWDARAVEHLYNRAGFGARPPEIEGGVKMGRQAFVRMLLAGGGAAPEPFAVDESNRPERGELYKLSEEERKQLLQSYRRQDARQLVAYAGWWMAQMLDSDHPLRERMTLFWHGFLTSGAKEVKNSVSLIEQNRFYREHALGSFRDLAHGIVHDPAMLAYLDNNKNKKGAPNENLARELMELFTLGEGNYTEQDVKEAARALTGWHVRDGEFYVSKKQHDHGQKTVLGVTGDLDGDALVDILLAQEACPRWLSKKLLAHFEGVEPSPERVEDYARFLRANDLHVGRFLERLFNDPEFYSPRVVGERISGPIDYLAGTCRRLGIDPPPVVVTAAAGLIGQQLFNPPSVKGWDGGRSWITTSTFLQRGNLAGMLLGVVKLSDVFKEDPELAAEEPASMDPEEMDASGDDSAPMKPADDAPEPRQRGPGAMRANVGAESGDGKSDPRAALLGKGEGGRGLRLLQAFDWRPNINLTARCEFRGARTDAAIADSLASELLAVEVSPEGRLALLEFLRGERAALNLDDGALLGSRSDSERVLRRLAHLILSLPEAQLH